MRCFLISLMIWAIIVVVIAIIWLLIYLRMRWACKKVRSLCCEEKEEKLNEALSPFGFRYERNGDLITTRMYPWQREMGYCKAYDEAAFTMNMVFDSEPIYFNYEGRRWLLELWKGQYGCTTGGEIGLYVNDKADMEIAPDKLFYECVEDDDRLHMQFVLYKNNRIIIKRRELQWWLTGFCVGEYSRPEQLSMEVALTFQSSSMRMAVYEGLIKVGYSPSEIYMDQYRIRFMFNEPYSLQRSKSSKFYKWLICKKNRCYCRFYCIATGCVCSTLDRISFVGYCFPLLYRVLIRIGTKYNRKKLRRFRNRYNV